MKVLRLKVAEAIQDDVNKGIVRIDSSFMKEVGVRPGDILEIEGERKTIGIVDRAYPGDIGLNIIRMDGIIRRNAKTGIGESVGVRKADVKEAKKIVIAPARKGIIIRVSPDLIKQGLLGRAVVKGDIVSLGGTGRRRRTMTDSPFFDDIFSVFDESMIGFGFGDIKFIVASTMPKEAVIISDLTEVEFNPEAVEVEEEKILEVTYEDIGGLEDEIKKIREMVELPLKHPEVFERLGIEPPKGVLLHGTPGCGKTLLAKAVANETNSHFILINGPEVMSKWYGQSEKNIKEKFEEAEKNAPSIIFIDEIDAIAPRREDVHGEVERRVVAQLLAMMDGLKSRGKVVVIAATNIPNVLDPALRRPGRFDREIEIGVPSKEGRLNVFKIHTRNMPLKPNMDINILRKELNESISEIEELISERERQSKNGKEKEPSEIKELENKKKNLSGLRDKLKGVKFNKDLRKLLESGKLEKEQKRQINVLIEESMLKNVSEVTHGFVGADLAALSKEAAMIVLRKVLPDLKLDEEEAIPHELLEKLRITANDFKEALKIVRPSAMREVLVEVPSIKWEDIGGLEDVKQELKEAVEWPIKNPGSFKQLGVKPPRGILLYGPPGTGKTLLAKAVANESEANFISIKGPEILSKWINETPQLVRKLFQKARQVSPTIVFIDEIDSIASRREPNLGSHHGGMNAVEALLTEMDGLEDISDIVIIGATNRPDILDTALLRTGRFDRFILTPVPDKKTREEIFKVHTKGMPLKDTDIKKLAERTEGYVGSDIEAICREAAIISLRKDIKSKEVTGEDFNEALKKVRPSVTKEIVKAYEEIKDSFSQARAKQMKDEKPSYMG